MDDFDCTAAGQAIAEFVEELSNWYVRLSRRRFWEGDRAAFATLRHCLLETAAMLAPFTPFLADEIHLNLAGGEAEELGGLPDSVHLRDFPEVDAALADPELETAMAAVRQTVELGRAARAQAKVKVRQPLRRAVIVANEEERAAIRGPRRPRHRRAQRQGARLRRRRGGPGQLHGQAQLSLAGPALRQAHAPGRGRGRGARPRARRPACSATAARSGSTSTATSTRSVPEDVTLALQPLEGYEVEAESGHAVALQLELDDELRREGLAREIVHAVQNARKAAGLEITDRIDLALAGDPDLLDAAREHEPYLSGEVLATSIAYDGDAAAASSATATIDGHELSIGVRRAGL